MRIVGVLRISRDTDESTAITRQRAAVQAWADARNATVVGWAVDEDVSGAVSPFDRPELGPWLTDQQASEYDALVAATLDRFARSSLGFLTMTHWLTDRGKAIATANNQVDTTTAEGRLVATVLSAVAEMERELISSRVRSSQSYLRQLGRWGGGPAPFGYKTVKRDNGTFLAIDEPKAAIVRDLVAKRLEGWSYEKLAQSLNDAGVARPRKKDRWQSGTVRGMLLAPWLLGQRAHRGKIIRDDKGVPVQFGPPLVTDEQFKKLSAPVFTKSRQTLVDNYLLKGRVVCGHCGSQCYMSALNQKQYGYYYYYRCGDNRSERCPARPNISFRHVDSYIEELIMFRLGDEQVMERRLIPGSDHLPQIERLTANITRMRKEADIGAWDDAQNEYLTKLGELSAERKRLSALPTEADRWESIPTGVTFGERWESAGIAERQTIMDGIELSVTLHRQGEIPEQADPPMGWTSQTQPIGPTKLENGIWITSVWRS